MTLKAPGKATLCRWVREDPKEISRLLQEQSGYNAGTRRLALEAITEEGGWVAHFYDIIAALDDQHPIAQEAAIYCLGSFIDSLIGRLETISEDKGRHEFLQEAAWGTLADLHSSYFDDISTDEAYEKSQFDEDDGA